MHALSLSHSFMCTLMHAGVPAYDNGGQSSVHLSQLLCYRITKNKK